MRRSTPFKPSLEILENRALPAGLPLYYSINGTGNNLTHTQWGAAGTNLLRVAGTAYGDGISSMSGDSRANPRVISNTIGAQAIDPEPNTRNMSDMIYAWGQFLDHDLDLTPNGSTEYTPIAVPQNDPVFSSAIPFFRSQAIAGTGVTTPRQQPNAVTSFLDGSMIYGSDATRAAALRTHVDGRMNTSTGNLLPLNSANLPVNVDIPGVDAKGLFLTGDVRGNENVELAALQTLFVREHNYWAGKLKSQYSTWTDEQIYQGSRRIVIAELQHITYAEFLPALLGSQAIAPYHGYNAKVNPAIAAEFSAGAYRMGHSLLNANVDFFNNDGTESHDPLDFSASADNPAILSQPGTSIDNVLKYLAADNAQRVDNHIEDSFRNFLFDPTNHAGLDLYALDVQRGRDMGLPDYNSIRAAYGLPKVQNFSDITSNSGLQAKLKALDGTVDNIDLFDAGLAENHLPGSSLGATFSAIIVDQFTRLRDGDRLWYERTFKGDELQMIRNTSLADIISRNTTISNLQDNVFIFAPGTISGRVFLDADRNGQRAANEAGIAGVFVQLLTAAGKPISSTSTAKDGSYHFDNLKLGRDYQIRISYYKTAAPALTTISKPATIVDNSGSGAYDIDFGLRSNWRPFKLPSELK